MTQKHCVCGKVIKLGGTLCSDCSKQYGSDRDKWPEWLLFLVRSEDREVHRELNHHELEYFDETTEPDAVIENQKPYKRKTDKQKDNSLSMTWREKKHYGKPLQDPNQNFDDSIEDSYH